jgi:hypothetical protein
MAGLVEDHEQVASLLGSLNPGGMSGDPEDVHPARGVLDDEERIEPVQVIVSRWSRSQARIACACVRKNSVQVGPARRGAGSIPAVWRIFQIVEAPIW